MNSGEAIHSFEHFGEKFLPVVVRCYIKTISAWVTLYVIAYPNDFYDKFTSHLTEQREGEAYNFDWNVIILVIV